MKKQKTDKKQAKNPIKKTCLFHEGGGGTRKHGTHNWTVLIVYELVICGHKVFMSAAGAANISITDIFYVCSVGRAS